jgi:hypothetical protein
MKLIGQKEIFSPDIKIDILTDENNFYCNT